MLKFFTKLIGSKEQRDVKKLQPIVNRINSLDSPMKALSEDQLRAKTDEFKQRLKGGETLDDLLPEAFAVVREAAIRTLGQRPYDVQLLGGIALHQGSIAEMKTGEGKTLAATMPVYLNALLGRGVHIATVNNYLAKRDAEWMGKIYRFLGLSVGVTLGSHEMSRAEKREAYQADITYGIAQEFGFDYLWDNIMASRIEDKVQREFYYCIIDEVDSVLIDESRTPLIISGERTDTSSLYETINRIIPKLQGANKNDLENRGVEKEEYEEKYDYIIDDKSSKRGAASLTEGGVVKVEKLLGVGNLYDHTNIDLAHHVTQALTAHTLYKRDVDYVVQDGQVIIVDEFTGRLQPGRRYEGGLHQALEAKEHVRIEEETQTTARVSYQNYYRMYAKLAGMTGTAATEAREFGDIYKLDVVVIPTNEPMIRIDNPDVVYKTETAKFRAVVNEIKQLHEMGRPVLVGTHYIETSERLSDFLRKERIPHQVLNAKEHTREAEIIAQAGISGKVTIATNMAGRGVDIMLGGDPEGLARHNLREQGVDLSKLTADSEEWKKALQEAEKNCAADKEKILSLGGLHILGTERHDARRIDNQLRGRSGRQGDPGSSRFYLSLEDELMKKFGGERLARWLDRAGMDENIPIEHKWVSSAIEKAQRRVEHQHFEVRKQLLKLDDTMNEQRHIIYEQRDMVLKGDDLQGKIFQMLEDVVDEHLETFLPKNMEEWDINGLIDWVKHTYTIDISRWDTKPENMAYDDLRQKLLASLHAAYEKREQEMGPEMMRNLERIVMLDRIDRNWMDHLYNIDYLEEGIWLRGYEGKDPVVVFKNEAFSIFGDMIARIKEEVTEYMFKAQLVKEAPVRRKTTHRQGPAGRRTRPFGSTPTAHPGSSPQHIPGAPAEKIGRNEPCPCGSGKKYKKCCGR
ncbi:preprotein translocase subunit SecA [Candidatus Poribacteria bacterium]|nr:preprotein translocase subunit SecA [Candidatus Poribacteria bacterium]